MGTISGELTPQFLDPKFIPPPKPLAPSAISPQHMRTTRRNLRQSRNTQVSNSIISPSPNNFNTFEEPTPSQQLAVIVLRGFDSTEIIAWLKILRSLAPPLQLRDDGPGIFSQQEMHALFEFEHCSDASVTAWLALANHRGHGRNDSRSFAPIAPTVSLPILQRQSTRSIRRPSGKFDAQIPPPSLEAQASAAPDTSSQGNLAANVANSCREEGETPPALNTTTYDRWCTLSICDDRKPFTTSDGYKRHMREHETEYQCMLTGAVENTMSGPKCSFCGRSGPDWHHLEVHGVFECKGTDGKPCSYTRMSGLILHLQKTHGVDDSRWLAEKWRKLNKNSKEYFGCGVCVSCFPSLTEQTNHIDTKHWSRSEKLSDWQPDKVILSLLCQPNVHDAWKRLLTRHRVHANTKFIWPKSVIADLQQKLEQSLESPEVMASWAFTRSSYYQHHRTEIESSMGSEHRGNENMGRPFPSASRLPQQQYSMAQGPESSPVQLRFQSTPASYSPFASGYNSQTNGPLSIITGHGSNNPSSCHSQPRAPVTLSLPHLKGAIADEDYSSSTHHSDQSFDTSSILPISSDSSALITGNSFTPHGNMNFGFDIANQHDFTAATPYAGWPKWQDGFARANPVTAYDEPAPVQPPQLLDSQSQAGEPFDAAEVDGFLSSYRDTTLPINQDIPDRRIAPFAITVSKRKRPGSVITDNDTRREADMDIEVHNGQRSRYRSGDDHLRRKRRSDLDTDYQT